MFESAADLVHSLHLWRQLLIRMIFFSSRNTQSGPAGYRTTAKNRAFWSAFSYSYCSIERNTFLRRSFWPRREMSFLFFSPVTFSEFSSFSPTKLSSSLRSLATNFSHTFLLSMNSYDLKTRRLRDCKYFIKFPAFEWASFTTTRYVLKAHLLVVKSEMSRIKL